MHSSLIALSGALLLPFTHAIPVAVARLETAQKPVNHLWSSSEPTPSRFVELLPRANRQGKAVNNESCPTIKDPMSAAAFQLEDRWDQDAWIAHTPMGYLARFLNLRRFVPLDSPISRALIQLQAYNVTECAIQCNDTDPCEAFSVQVMRLPVAVPSDACPVPPSLPFFICQLLGQRILEEPETSSFNLNRSAIMVAASNIYNKVDDAVITKDHADGPKKSLLAPISKRFDTLAEAKCKNDPKIINGGFEMDDPGKVITPTGWKISEIAPTVTVGFTKPGSGNDGQTYGFVTNLLPNDISKATNGLMLSQKLNTCAGQEYNVTFDYRFDNAADGKCSIALGLGDGSKPKNIKTRVWVSGDRDDAKPHIWITPSTAFKATTNNDLLAFFFSCESGKWNNYSLDNVRVEFQGKD